MSRPRKEMRLILTAHTDLVRLVADCLAPLVEAGHTTAERAAWLAAKFVQFEVHPASDG